ncbi:unnamed protein product [Mytilus edulis]|uniref:Uncharacterized protein n=1 Tax=Mytilus edulis TaxID=6550 RepID=A0A8S3Q858_MYTED|nr:unnamed protein product [Mytilus edulis]
MEESHILQAVAVPTEITLASDEETQESWESTLEVKADTTLVEETSNEEIVTICQQYKGTTSVGWINSSKNKISMNWSITDGDLILICHVEDLFLQVEFLHDSKSFQAYCLPPYPSPMCTSYNDGIITQDPKTNCTKLVLSSTITSYFSFWSCNHGLNSDTSNQIFVEKKVRLCSLIN